MSTANLILWNYIDEVALRVFKYSEAHNYVPDLVIRFIAKSRVAFKTMSREDGETLLVPFNSRSFSKAVENARDADFYLLFDWLVSIEAIFHRYLEEIPDLVAFSSVSAFQAKLDERRRRILDFYDQPAKYDIAGLSDLRSTMKTEFDDMSLLEVEVHFLAPESLSVFGNRRREDRKLGLQLVVLSACVVLLQLATWLPWEVIWNR